MNKSLTKVQKRTLIDEVVDQMKADEVDIWFISFSDKVHDLLDDVPGFELVEESDREQLVNELWSIYQDEYL